MWRKTSWWFGFGGGVCVVSLNACATDDSTDGQMTSESGGPIGTSQPNQKSPNLPDSVAQIDGGARPGTLRVDEALTKPVNPPVYATCAPARRTGQFRIEMTAEVSGLDQFSSIWGKVDNGVVPSRVVEVEQQSGDCQLLKGPRFSCSPPCAATETCGGSGCADYPLAQDVGTVSVTGLKVPIEMEASISSRSYSNPVSAMLPFPAMDEHAGIYLSAPGGPYSAFSLAGIGIAPLELTPRPITIASGSAAQVEWEAASALSSSQIVLQLNIDNHGSSAASIQCQTADDGSAEIPAELIDALLANGFSGYPTLTVRRQFVSTVELDAGCVEMVLSSEYVGGLEIDGLVSCGQDADCPSGQACQPQLVCE